MRLFGGELTVPPPDHRDPISDLAGQVLYVGNVKELRELMKMAQDGKLEALPVAAIPQRDANDALMRLRDGRVTGRLLLKTDVN